jgi:hypothetical protein
VTATIICGDIFRSKGKTTTTSTSRESKLSHNNHLHHMFFWHASCMVDPIQPQILIEVPYEKVHSLPGRRTAGFRGGSNNGVRSFAFGLDGAAIQTKNESILGDHLEER